MVCSKMHGTQWLATGLSAFTLAFAAMAPSQAATVAAVPGWNLLGYSDAAAVKVSDAFGDATKLTTVWKWDAASSKWAFYSPSFATPTDLANYAASKGYLVLTTINSGEGFWVNAKASFSATLPAAPAPVVNPEALAGIQATLTAFENLYATAIPSAVDLGGLLDDTFLSGGRNKTDTIQRWVSGTNSLADGVPLIGMVFGNMTLTQPADAGQANDETHQWFTFNEGAGNGSPSPWLAIKQSPSPWLAIKQSDGKWRLAGEQKMFGFYASPYAAKHIPPAQSGGAVTYSSEFDLGVKSSIPPGVFSQVVVSGPGVVPSAGALVYSTAKGRTYLPPCGNNQVVTNCIDISQVIAGAQYIFKGYTVAGGITVPAYTYAATLGKAPLQADALAAAQFPTITGVDGTWAPSTSVTVNWTLPAGFRSDWIGVFAVPTGAGVIRGVRSSLTSTSLTASFALPNYSGTLGSRGIWLDTYDANGNQLTVDYQMSAP